MQVSDEVSIASAHCANSARAITMAIPGANVQKCTFADRTTSNFGTVVELDGRCNQSGSCFS
jgi:hypothetical protein